MALHSIQYLLFLSAVFAVYQFSPDRLRWLVLLAASILFYLSLGTPYLLGALLYVAAVSYLFGRWTVAARTQTGRRRLFWTGVMANLSVLIVLKYLPFVVRNLSLAVGEPIHPESTLAGDLFLSIGVSYFVFQAISYLADVYLELEDPEHHFGYFALYLAFFPKLLQGPIERHREFLPQLKRSYSFDYGNARVGIQLIGWGLFKKIVVADRIALWVDPVFDHVHEYSGWVFVVAAYLFSLQIYFDFSAYTDMALGAGRLFNLRLTQNFNNPLAATSIADFWRRWHISFSRWILDYMFRPLQVTWRRWGVAGTAMALTVAFVASGLWHGANWTFITWGFLQGAFLAGAVLRDAYLKKLHPRLVVSRLPRAWRIVITLQLVTFAWIFFRSRTIADAGHIIRSILVDLGGWPSVVGYLRSLGWKQIVVGAATGTLVLVFERDGGSERAVERLSRLEAPVRWMAYYGLVVCIYVLGVYGGSRFIYFRF